MHLYLYSEPETCNGCKIENKISLCLGMNAVFTTPLNRDLTSCQRPIFQPLLAGSERYDHLSFIAPTSPGSMDQGWQ